MKFAIGYQLPYDEINDISKLAILKKDKISEVYFPWVNSPSGRSVIGKQDGYTDWSAQEQLENDLISLKSNGIKLDLILNSNCYGENSLSIELANFIHSIIDRIAFKAGGVDIITTASLAVAYIVKQISPDIEVRASVNMRIGTPQAIDYIKHLFDSFYIMREYNRDFKRINIMKEWAKKHNKSMYFLANSGCMPYCSGQTFHDNLVAHEEQISTKKNINFPPHVCREYYKNKDNFINLIKSTWVRPEDMCYYDDFFPLAKLATRMHEKPAMVVEAYTSGTYYGNLLDLLEPSNCDIVSPYIIDNTAFPANWAEKVGNCDKLCGECNFCKFVLDNCLHI